MDDLTNESDSSDLTSLDDEEREWRTVAHRSFERDSNTDLTTVIVEAIAAIEDRDPTTITSPPLFEVVNVPAIEALFFDDRSIEGRQRTCTGSVHVFYRGVRVTVTSDGQVLVAEPVHDDDYG